MKHRESWRKQDYPSTRSEKLCALAASAHKKEEKENANVIFFNMSFHQLLLLRQHELTKKKLVNTKARDQRVDMLDYT